METQQSCGGSPPLCPQDQLPHQQPGHCSPLTCAQRLLETHVLPPPCHPAPWDRQPRPGSLCRAVLAAARSRAGQRSQTLTQQREASLPLPTALHHPPDRSHRPVSVLPKGTLLRSRATCPVLLLQCGNLFPGGKTSKDPTQLSCPLCSTVRGAEGSAAETPVPPGPARLLEDTRLPVP